MPDPNIGKKWLHTAGNPVSNDSLFHVRVHVREVVLHDVVGGAVGDGAESERGLDRLRVGQPLVLHPGEVGELLPGDHEGRQVGRVDGQEDQGEGSPDVRDEPVFFTGTGFNKSKVKLFPIFKQVFKQIL